ncbi:hypothetical protein WDW86_16125 [Bdellovibrionota bacterium FG-2]
MILRVLLALTVLGLSSSAFANYRCGNWKIQSIGQELQGSTFFYVNGGFCKKYQLGEGPFNGPNVSKKTPFFKITLDGSKLDEFIKHALLARSDAYDRYLEFDLVDSSFANSPDELGIDITSLSLLFVNLVGQPMEVSKGGKKKE